MRFAYHPSMCDPSFYLELGKAAESAGFDVITFPDSICYPKECDSTYPYNDDGSREFLDGVPFLEPFSIIPAIAAVTTKLEFSTSVYKLAPRQAVTTAKFVTTLGVMTNNRFHFGIGVSPWYEDFLATGERWEKRGKRMDEQIEILKGLMVGDYFGFKGEFYDIPELKLCPVPTKPVPILIPLKGKPESIFEKNCSASTKAKSYSTASERMMSLMTPRCVLISCSSGLVKMNSFLNGKMVPIL